MFMTHLIYKCKTVALAAIVLCVAAVSPLTATALPVDVAYTVTGSSGNYTLDFSFTNNLTPAPANMGLYFVGVSLSARDIAGSPAGYDPNAFTFWNNVSYGGSSITYNNTWFDGTYGISNILFPGSTLSGFQVHTTNPTAPTSVSWFAFGRNGGFGGQYTGGGNFNTSVVPGFEGVAQVQAVPEPSTLLLGGAGLVGLAAWRWKHAA